MLDVPCQSKNGYDEMFLMGSVGSVGPAKGGSPSELVIVSLHLTEMAVVYKLGRLDNIKYPPLLVITK